MLAITFGSRLGEGNRKRMDELLPKIPDAVKSISPGLQAYSNISKQMDTLGDSYATPQLFADSQVSAMTSALIKGCGLDRDKAKKTTPKLISTKMTKLPTEAVYLSSNVHGYEQTYLISGTWDEEWKYEACDNIVAVNIKFVADGLGGAKFSMVQSGKDISNINK